MPIRAAAAAAASCLAALAAPAFAACPTPQDVTRFLEDAEAARPATPLVEEGAASDAVCARDLVIEQLIPVHGAIVGWKAGLTSPQAQAAFGVTEPVLGALLKDMLLKDGAVVDASARIRPLFEADLVVEIADEGVMDARTHEEVLQHIRGVRPFLELPALLMSPDRKLDGAVVTSMNVGAWRGVLGDLIEIPSGPEGVEMLANLTARVTDAEGEVLSEAPGKAVLGNPLQAVIWVAGQLEAQGRTLSPGSLVSVGSIGPLHPMKAGGAATVTYEGLPGTPSVSASFE